MAAVRSCSCRFRSPRAYKSRTTLPSPSSSFHACAPLSDTGGARQRSLTPTPSCLFLSLSFSICFEFSFRSISFDFRNFLSFVIFSLSIVLNFFARYFSFDFSSPSLFFQFIRGKRA